MSNQEPRGQRTRQRLLEAACAVFAEKGYGDATVSEICDCAEANIAAINYHFGDKESLYDHACRHAYEIASRQHPIDGGLPAEAPPRERIHAFVHALLQRIFSETDAGWFPRFVVNELTKPTPLFEDMFHRALEPNAEALSSTIAGLIDEDLPTHQLRLLAFGVLSQCLFFAVNRPVRERIMSHGSFDAARIAELAEHITTFSIAGIHAAAERMAAGGEKS